MEIRKAAYLRGMSKTELKRQAEECIKEKKIPYAAYVDIAHCGDQRPGLERLIRDAGKHMYDEIVVTDISRVHRDAGRCMEFLRKMRELGIMVHDPAGRSFTESANMISAAEDERRIAERNHEEAEAENEPCMAWPVWG